MLTIEPDAIERELPPAGKWTLQDWRAKHVATTFELESYNAETGEACVYIRVDGLAPGLMTISATGRVRVIRKAR